MAGSYNHCIDDEGNLLSNEQMMLDGAMIENLGDAYEAIEEMYGMIWWLAHMGPNAPAMDPADLVELARQHYAEGVGLARQTPGKEKYRP